MDTSSLLAVITYFTLLLVVAILSYRRQLSASEFLIGGRSMNYWLTALAAHASDMSSWLFMGYPALIFAQGGIGIWTAIGLFVFMFLNWKLVAPRIRIATEQYNCVTFSAFFENRFADTTGVIRVFTSLMLLFFYTVYISAALVGLGILLETLFHLPYAIGIGIGILIIIPYVFTGGFVTLAWIDLFQGMFLLAVILFVPLYIAEKLGGWSQVITITHQFHISTSLLPSKTWDGWIGVLGTFAGWGLGYFGQPHIVTKFMGIRKVNEISKSMAIGMAWMFVSLGAATLVGFVGIPFFHGTLKNSEHVFIDMVVQSFPGFIGGFFLCGVLAATINAMSSQVLVLSSTITEDLYKKLIHPTASSKERLIAARIGVIFVSIVTFVISYYNESSIYALVLYAWSGLGAAFGPLVLLGLYAKKINKYGAWAGVLSGGIIAGIWPLINDLMKFEFPPLIPGFFVSFILILLVSALTNSQKVEEKA